MEINKKTRAELKAYFIKNALPTSSNFGELIDAAVNQKDDGLTKAADQPVQIAASSIGDRPAIHLYESFATDLSPAWAVSLLVGGKKGFGVSDGGGQNRLFIDGAIGNVGIGTADPQSYKLAVSGAANVAGQLTADGLGVSGAANVAGQLTAGGLAVSGAASVPGQLTAGGLAVSGAANVAGQLTAGGLGVSGATSVAGLFTATGGATVTGPLRNSMWKVTSVLDQKPGKLPVSGTFTSSGGTLVVFASGSGMRGDTGLMGMNINLDGARIGASRVWSNVSNAHQAFVPLLLVVPGIAAGNHTVQLVHFDGFSDGNDYYSVTVMELPF
jgi:hypothetical protein